jgi:outer membrane receptor protein involved in Fe transport
VSWTHKYNAGTRHEIMLGLGTLNIDAAIGELVKQRIRAPTLFSRAEWHLPVTSTLTLDAGWDVVGYRGRVAYEGPRYRNDNNEPGVDAPPETRLNQLATIAQPAVFAEVTWMPHEQLHVIPGVRVDYSSDIQQVTVDPRLATRWSVTDQTTLKAGVGRFSQPPELGSAFPQLGNPDVRSSSALHTSIGIEQRIGDHLQTSVEGYAKTLWDLPVNAATGPSPINGGTGRIFGVELSARFQYAKSFGFVSYTLSRSERSTHGGPFRLHDYDQPHILNLSGGTELGRGWEVSGTFRLVSGNPETPVVGAIYNADKDEHLPIYGIVNSARATTFHRLDLRIQKRWDLGAVKLSLYLDVINAYNQQNNEVTEYGFDYRTESGVSGFPLLPVLGFRGEI